MLYSTSIRRSPFISLSGGVGLVEKRLNINSPMDLTSVATKVGDWNHGLATSILLNSNTQSHTNHASDPSAVTMALGDAVGIIRDLPRSLVSNVALADTVHACLCGYHPSSGDPDLNKHSVIFDSGTLAGQVVYISGDGHVDKAQANNAITMDAIGLALNTVTINSTDFFLTEGSITRLDWTGVASTSLLSPGTIYYLSASLAGQFTPVAPSSGFVVRVGRAITTTTIDIEISQEVRL